MPHAERLRRYLREKIPASLRGQLAAEDVLQEVWIRAYRDSEKLLSFDDAAIETWLLRVTNHRLLNAIKHATRLKRGGDLNRVSQRHTSLLDLLVRVASPERSPSSVVARREAVDAIQLAIGTLPENQYRAIWWHYVDGQSVASIAKRVSKNKHAIEATLVRGRENLRRRFSDWATSTFLA
jgi:RNA polymerase sigma-70 factor, ECF subfamily